MSNRFDARPQGMELIEITPIMVGGDPSDPQNKTMVTRQQHFEIVRYWNRVIRNLRNGNRVSALSRISWGKMRRTGPATTIGKAPRRLGCYPS